MKPALTLLFFLCLGSKHLAFGETDVDQGHSVHGHVFNEGPRQAAVLIPGTGNVVFPVHSLSERAQLFFDQGIGQLHGYWDFEAERSFRQVAKIKPDCAMAYWGMAMANFKNTDRARGFIEQAMKHREQASDKDKMYIDCLADYFSEGKLDNKKRRKNLSAALEKITEQYADDIEAQAFWMRQLYQNSRKGVPYGDIEKVNSIAKNIFAQQPDHPAHHYVIHLWDYKKPARALKSAESGGPAAPSIAHMWHMPGHTYDKLKQYRETAFYQEASARVDHQHLIKYRLLPDQIHNFQHNNAWLVKTLSYLGRKEDAISLAKNMVELPRIPKFKTKDDKVTYNSLKSSWRSGRQRLKEVLIRFEQWQHWIELEQTPYLKPDEKTLMAKDIKKYSAIARFETGDFEGGQKILDDFKKQLAEENKKTKKPNTKTKDLQSRVNELIVYRALNSQSDDQMLEAKGLLMKLQKVNKSRLAFLHHRAGNHDKAVELAEQAVKSAKNQVFPLAVQVQVLHGAGKVEQARTAFDQLRDLACDADRDLPVLKRLEPIAEAFDYPKVWQKQKPIAVNVDIESLGPFRWTPPKAPDFDLCNDCGENHRLSDRKNKNTLLIFYLGKGCTHCMEQLNEFGPMMQKFADNDIDIIAVSSDTVDGLAETFSATEGEEQNRFPFTLLSDSSLEIFKKYRAFDDFENQPLHGTFLIDGQQNIRWQDISFEPFMHSDWLLEECCRLLGTN